MSITVDLGEIREDIAHFAAHFDNKRLHGIGTPVDIRLYTSIDGVEFELLDAPRLTLDRKFSCFYINKPATARYVKMSIGDIDSHFAFCSEFLIGVDHVHAPEDAWTSDSDFHWHQCSCGEQFDLDRHETGGWTVVRDPDVWVDGILEAECTVCGKIITEIIPGLEPSPGEGNYDYILGDINQNGKIDMMDYILAKRKYFNN